MGVFSALLWKNYMLKRRNKKGTACELIFPIFVVAVLALLRPANNPLFVEDFEDGWITSQDFSTAQISSFGATIFPRETVATLLGETFNPPGEARIFLQNFAGNNGLDVIEKFKSFALEKSGFPAENNTNVSFAVVDDQFNSLTPGLDFGETANVEEYVNLADYVSEDFSEDLPQVLLLIEFNQVDLAAAVFEYTLRLPQSDTFAEVAASAENSGAEPVNKELRGIDLETLFEYESFIGTQRLLDLFSILEVNRAARAVEDLEEEGLNLPQNLIIVPYAVKGFSVNSFFDGSEFFIGFFFVLAISGPFAQLAFLLIRERQVRAKEFLHISGITDVVLLSSWAVSYAIYYLVVAIVIAGVSALVFAHSSVSILFLIYILFFLSVIPMSMVVSAVFTRGNLGAAAAVLVNFGAYIGAQSLEGVGIYVLVPHMTFALIMKNIVGFETLLGGVDSETINTDVNGFTVSQGIWFLLLDLVLWSLLALYLNLTLPQATENPLPFTFFVDPNYWRSSRKVLDEDSKKEGDADYTVPVQGVTVEPVNDTLRQQITDGIGIQIRGLSKFFSSGSGTVRAVNEVDLDVYEGEILSLLGHNGAGKTSLLRILSGAYKPTKGDARVYGAQLTKSLDKIRSSLGFCPQENLLYPELTVFEHLKFYLKVKGVGGNERVLVERSAAEVGLSTKLHTRASSLSGGMKRRLSLAISMVGGSKVVFVDEPTSGVDPWNRRALWDILKNCKEGRVIILTTHFMDEAEILGDRIAIMSEGTVKCNGSFLFLRDAFGAGYQLSCIKTPDESSGVKCEDKVLQTISGSELIAEEANELLFYLPSNQAPTFSKLFEELDDLIEQQNINITTYGVSGTTMEEIFLKVGQSTDLKEGLKRLNSKGSLRQEAEARAVVMNNEKSSEAALSSAYLNFFPQFTALFVKRLRYSKTDIGGLMCGCFIPLLLIILFFWLLVPESASEVSTSLNSLTLETTFPDIDTITIGFQEYESDGVLSSIGSGSVNSEIFFPDVSIDFLEEEIVFEDDSIVENLFGSIDFYARNPVVNFNHQLALSLSEVILDEDLAGRDIPLTITYTDSSDSIVIFANTKYRHAFPTGLNLIDNALLLASVSDLSLDAPRLKASSSTIVINNQEDIIVDSFDILTYILLFLVAVSLVPGPIIAYIVMENDNNTGFQSMQFISGANIPSYWMSNFLFDLVFCLPVLMGTLVLLLAFDPDLFDGNLEVVFGFFCYVFSSSSFCYLAAKFFKLPGNAQLVLVVVNSLVAVALSFTIFIMSLLQVFDTLEPYLYALRLLPIVSFTDFVINLYFDFLLAELNLPAELFGGNTADEKQKDVFYMLFSGIVYLLLVVSWNLLLNKGDIRKFANYLELIFTRKPRREVSDTLDSDVKAEKQRVAAGEIDDVLQLKELEKMYPNGFQALKGVSVGVPEGECFGYLGVNGSGKTTTIRCLVGNLIATGGTASIKGFDVVSQQTEVRQNIGYCNQFGSLLGNLTVMQHLELFCSFKLGELRRQEEFSEATRLSASNLINKHCNELVDRLSLRPFANKKSKTLSGGNKRKLSVAIAMVGSPSVMLLDEPSTGMDVASRRFMWNIIQDMRQGKFSTTKTSIVLTTHSMEECEALCSRLGILNAGQLRALGTPQHLKEKFGTGYILDLKLKTVTREDIETRFGNISASDTYISMPDLVTWLQENGLQKIFISAAEAKNFSALSSLAAKMDIRAGIKYLPLQAVYSWLLLEEKALSVLEFLKDKFHSAGFDILEQRDEHMKVKMNTTYKDTKLGNIFRIMEEKSTDHGVVQYAISQTTLEQVFNSLAQEGAGREEDGAGTGYIFSNLCKSSNLKVETEQSKLKDMLEFLLPETSALNKFHFWFF
eukprot:maker-scaffold_101-snap-gene-0.3-mRNA-1 protein AED:0.17 eAED:0.19 QI:0/0/0/1/0.5/0.33/3/0/1862